MKVEEQLDELMQAGDNRHEMSALFRGLRRPVRL